MNKKILAALMAVLLVLNLLGVGYTAAEETPQTLKVVTWNIRHGNDRMDEQRAQLLELDADICFLQEVDEGTNRVGGLSCLDVLGGEEYSCRRFGSARRYDGGRFGTGILSRQKLTRFKSNRAGIGYTKAVWKQGERTVSIYNVHLDYENDETRAGQIAALAEEFFSDKNTYRIIAGDFNLKDFSELDVFGEMGMINNDLTYYPTYHGLDWDTQAIDNIIYTSDTLQPVETQMLVNDLSDHNALAVTFDFLEE